MPNKRHFAALDGLRGVAAGTVALLHLLEFMPVAKGPPQGQLAVDFFFMLSGFVVAYAYEQRLLATMSFSEFSVIRLIRLYPIVFFGVVLGVISRLMDGAAGHGTSAVLGAAAFALLLLPVPRRSGPTPVSAFPLNGPLWSLTYELLSNLAYAAAIRWLSTRVLLVFCALSCVALCSVVLKGHGVGPSVEWGMPLIYGFARVFASFSIGVLIFRLGGSFRQRSDALAVGAALMLAAVLWAPFNNSPIFDLVAILVVFPIILFAAANSPDDSPVCQLWKVLGMVSYPLYAINQPVFRLCGMGAKWLGISDAGLPAFAAASFIGCVIVSFAILRAYDEPVRRFLLRKWRARVA